MRIIVVEDERKTRAGIIRLIGKLSSDYEVVGEAEDGREGLALILQLQPDVVILDVQMPVMNGLEMLEELKRSRNGAKLVILSGHSEFEYARQAVRLGASEYLMKPITADDLEQTLRQLHQTIVMEKLFGAERTDIRDSSRVKLMPERPLWAAAIHPSAADEHSLQQTWQLLHGAINRTAPEAALLLERAADGSSILLGQTEAWDGKSRPAFADQLMEDTDAVLRAGGLNDIVWIWRTVDRLSMLPESLGDLFELPYWAIVIGNRIPLEDIASAERECMPLQYPISLEIKAKKAVSGADKGMIAETARQFLGECFRERHRPQDILEACYRFASSVLHVRGQLEQCGSDYQGDKELLLAVSKARTRQGLQEALLAVAAKASSDGPAAEMYGLLVNKALHMVRERYSQGISLEEAAAALNITPEYLSTLVNRETGKTFTAHLKEARVARAKELLLSGELKAFEISARVGYADSKYFCRVFKEHTGMTPVEYQKKH